MLLKIRNGRFSVKLSKKAQNPKIIPHNKSTPYSTEWSENCLQLTVTPIFAYSAPYSQRSKERHSNPVLAHSDECPLQEPMKIVIGSFPDGP